MPEQHHWIVTGADSRHFANSRMLVASWWDTNRQLPLAFCDFGLTSAELSEVRSWPVTLLSIPRGLEAPTHSWRRKAALVQYARSLTWRTLSWIDADALILEPLDIIESLLTGFDLMIDVHSMAVGEIMNANTAARLPALDPRDAYFSSGFWSTRSHILLEAWDLLCANVVEAGGLWENDAFVASVYFTRSRVRPVCGNIWHVRGKTSLETCQVLNGRLTFAGIPCVVLHANAGYTQRGDGRRVFRREALRQIQDHFEHRFFQLQQARFSVSQKSVALADVLPKSNGS